MSDQREQDRNIETDAGWPTGHDMIRQLREALGLPVMALPVPPQQVWEEALTEVRRLAARSASVTPLPPPGTYQRLHCTACGETVLDVLAGPAPGACPSCGGRSWRVGGAPSAMVHLAGPYSVTQPVAPFTVYSTAGADTTIPSAPGPSGGFPQPEPWSWPPRPRVP